MHALIKMASRPDSTPVFKVYTLRPQEAGTVIDVYVYSYIHALR
jgi:hypothetical protein